jgi:hypothetical protein
LQSIVKNINFFNLYTTAPELAGHQEKGPDFFEEI